MTAAELVAAMNTLGWGARTLAHRLDINRRTVERWMADQDDVEPRVAAWIRGLAAEVGPHRRAIERVLAACPRPEGWE